MSSLYATVCMLISKLLVKLFALLKYCLNHKCRLYIPLFVCYTLVRQLIASCFVIHHNCVIWGPCYTYITFHLHQIDLSCTGFNVRPKCRLPIPQFYGLYCMYVCYTFVLPYITCFVIHHNCASSVDKGL